MINLRLLVFAGLLVLHANVFAQDTNFWIFLCFGQSNMEGFPGIEEQDKSGVDERFKVFAAVDFPKLKRKQGNWYPAVPSVLGPLSRRLFWTDAGFQSSADDQSRRGERLRRGLQN